MSKAHDERVKSQSRSEHTLRWPARLYLAALVLLALACFLDAIGRYVPVNLARFALYLCVAVAASVLKVRLPGIKGTMSVNFFLFLIGVVSLTVTETIVIGVVSAFAQTFWKSKSRPTLVRTAFNVALVAIALRVSYAVFHLELLGAFPVQFYLRLVLTAAVYFVMNTLPVAIMITLTEGKPLLRTWRETYFWVFSYYLVGAAFAAVFNALEKTMGWQASALVLPVVFTVYRAYRLYLNQVEAEKAQAEAQRAHAEEQRIHAEEVSALHLRTIEALAMAIEAKDQTTHDHLQRVQIYSVELGRKIGVSDDELQALRAAALLHDIGKLAVPEYIISKPGKLTPEEFGKMKVHPVVGAEILEHVQFPYPVVPIVRHHHERWDGLGYPDGLKGEEIPMGARILSVVDCLDALASDRQYRPALPLDKAMEEVSKMAGSNYDPSVVDVLRRHYREWEELARTATPVRAKLSTGIHIARGDAPSAGFETPATGPSEPLRAPAEFVTSIGAARHEAQVLFELTQDMASSLSLDEILSVVSVRLKKLIPYDTFAVYLKNGECLVPAFVTGDDFRLLSSLRIPLGQGLVGWVAQNHKPILNGNPSVEAGYLNDPSKFSLLRSALCVPMEGSDNLVGTLALYTIQGGAFNQDHLRILLMIASKLVQSVQNSLQYRNVEDTSMTDYLTGLANARSLFTHIEELLTAGTRFSTLVCDVDGFKQVNDRFGHLEGDALLKKIAAVLRRSCRDRDCVARMGGDEFVLLLCGVDATQSPDLLTRIVNAVEEAGFQQCGEPIVSLSVGVALAPEDGAAPEQLIAAADSRMYKAKNQKKRDRLNSGQLLQLASTLNRAELPSQPPEAAPRLTPPLTN